MLTDAKLREINKRRKLNRKSPLTRQEAEQAISSHNSSSDDATDFLIGYTTGVPWNGSPGGIVGAMVSPVWDSIDSFD